MAKHTGRLELTWTDKDKALLSTGDGKYDYTLVDRSDPRVQEIRLVHEVERVGGSDSALIDENGVIPTTDNLFITGDAMHVLDVLTKTPEYAKQFLGQVKLVYIDPPFNTGQAFDNYEDNIEHSVWLTMLRDRVRQIKPLLSRDGSLWVHLDDAEVHRCRSVLDEELGADAFVATVVWQKRTSRDNRAAFSDAQDYLLVYAPAGPQAWKRGRNLLPDLGEFSNPDNDPRGPWRSVPMSAQAGRATSSQFWTVTTPTGVRHDPPKGRAWTYTEPRFNELVEADLVYWPKGGDGKPRLKKFPGPDDGLVPFTLWLSDEVGTTDTAKKEIMTLFPDVEKVFDTPKPERLLERILHIATKPGDLVLDCFAGSGTTAAVAHKMGRRWITNELLPFNADTFVKPRLRAVVEGTDEGGISSVTERQPVPGVTLPAKVTPKDAQDFQTTLGRLLGGTAETSSDDDTASQEERDLLTVALDRELSKVIRAGQKSGDSDLTEADAKQLLALLKKVGREAELDVSGHVRTQLNRATRTRETMSVRWRGGGGFTHLRVGPSMYEVDEDGDAYLSSEATNGDWAKSVAAQLKFTLTPDHDIFCGVRNRQRLAVIDGVADENVIQTVLEHLGDGEKAVVVAKAVLPEARAMLTSASPGSRVKKAPNDLFPKRTVK